MRGLSWESFKKNSAKSTYQAEINIRLGTNSSLEYYFSEHDALHCQVIETLACIGSSLLGVRNMVAERTSLQQEGTSAQWRHLVLLVFSIIVVLRIKIIQMIFVFLILRCLRTALLLETKVSEMEHQFLRDASHEIIFTQHEEILTRLWKMLYKGSITNNSLIEWMRSMMTNLFELRQSDMSHIKLSSPLF